MEHYNREMVRGRPPQYRDIKDILDFITESKKMEEFAKRRPEVYDAISAGKIKIESVKRIIDGVATNVVIRVRRGRRSYKKYRAVIDPSNPIASRVFRGGAESDISRLKLMAVLAVHETMPNVYVTGKTHTVVGHSAFLLRNLKMKGSKRRP